MFCGTVQTAVVADCEFSAFASALTASGISKEDLDELRRLLEEGKL